MRRILNQAAHAAVKKKGCFFQTLFRRLLPRLGYKGAIWAVRPSIVSAGLDHLASLRRIR